MDQICYTFLVALAFTFFILKSVAKILFNYSVILCSILKSDFRNMSCMS